MKVKLKRSAWERIPKIDPINYGFDYYHSYEVEYVQEIDGIKSYKLLGGYLYDATYFEEYIEA